MMQYSALIHGKQFCFKTALDKFLALKDVWNEYNAGQSITHFEHLSYLQIIGMGAEIVPLLISRLQEDGGNFIFALKCITGEQAETEGIQGQADKVIAAWIKWGTEWLARR